MLVHVTRGGLVESAHHGRVAGLVEASYGLPTAMVGLGFVLCGGVVLRRRLLPWGRGLALAFGVWVFVVLVPALGGSDVAGRLAIGGWMVLFLLLGGELALRGHLLELLLLHGHLGDARAAPGPVHVRRSRPD